jgi:uncharacterized protein (DUF427 family)
MGSNASFAEIENSLSVPSVEPSPRWIRVRFGGEVVADSRRTLLLRQYGPEGLPTYYFPQADVRMDLLDAATSAPDASAPGGRAFHTLRVGDRVAENAAWIYTEPPARLDALAGHVSFAWSRMDGWYEEEEEIFVHARDPHTRVDVLQSARHVQVMIDGEVVAESRHPVALFETGLPVRYYLSPEDVRQDLLERTGLKTQCPYKGIASYWSARVGGRIVKNIVWSYPDPIPECPKIRGLMCFFNERVDLYVDGELQPRPHTPWSE